jgi:hypothetical protein
MNKSISLFVLFLLLLLTACSQPPSTENVDTVEPLVLPATWVGQSIGTAIGSGDVDANGLYTVNGSGTGITGTADNFYFVRQRPSGTDNNPTLDDGYLVSRINVGASFPQNAKAGIMMRETLNVGSMNAFVGIKKTGTSSYQVIFQTRNSTNGTTSTQATLTTTLPRLVKLERSNNFFRAYYAVDDFTWVQLGSAVQINMTAQTIYLGFAVASSNTTQANAIFTGVLNRRIYYISPTGLDSNSGKTFSQPWKTFPYAIPLLNPGDILVLKDGTYTRGSGGSGPLAIKCSAAGGTAKNGSAVDTSLPITSLKVYDTPITVRAYNKRQALIDTQGAPQGSQASEDDYAVLIKGCSYWVIEGISARNRDIPGNGFSTSVTTNANGFGEVIIVRGETDTLPNATHHIVLRHVLAYWPNRYGNNDAILLDRASDVLVEESEAYAFHRHGFSAYGSNKVTIVRSYANSANQTDRNFTTACIGIEGGCFKPGKSISDLNIYGNADGESHSTPGGDESFVLYGSSNSKVINSIAENLNEGFEAHGTDLGGQNNSFFGNINLNGIYGAAADSRLYNSNVYEPTNTYFKDLVIINPKDTGIILKSIPYNTSNPSSSQTVRFENVTIYGVDYAGGSQAGTNTSNTQGFLLRKNATGPVECSQLSTGICGFYMNKGLLWGNSIAIENTPNDFANFRIENSAFHANGSQSATGSNYVNVTLTTATPASTPPSSFPTTTFTYQSVTYPFLLWSTGTVGGKVRYRYNLDGTLSTTPLWSSSGFVSCGAELPTSSTATGGAFEGIYTSTFGKCKTVHQKLGVTGP